MIKYVRIKFRADLGAQIMANNVDATTAWSKKEGPTLHSYES